MMMTEPVVPNMILRGLENYSANRLNTAVKGKVDRGCDNKFVPAVHVPSISLK